MPNLNPFVIKSSEGQETKTKLYQYIVFHTQYMLIIYVWHVTSKTLIIFGHRSVS